MLEIIAGAPIRGKLAMTLADIDIQVLAQNEWATYRELRLLSLQDSPDSFGSTYEKEVQYTNDEWVTRLDLSCREGKALPLVARLNSKAVGLVWGLQHNFDDQVAYLYQMWISPSARGHGIGKLMLRRIEDWARQSDLKTIILEVTTTNHAAIKLYQNAGFRPFGELTPLRQGSALMVLPMRLDLCAVVE
jgi:ribosomal protein S18 acetylase RimI-like enzyme